MPRAYTELFYHLIWTTWKRQPTLTKTVQPDLYRYLGHKCKAYGYQAYAINGMEDHIHVVARLPATVTGAEALGKLKGSSSHFLTKNFEIPFRWQKGYGAFTFGKRDLQKVVEYVEHQKRHHQKRCLNPSLEYFEEEWPEKQESEAMNDLAT